MSMVENIKSLCIQKGISIPKLEIELGFGRGAIYNWDKNSPSIDKVQKVAEYFSVTTDELLQGEKEKLFDAVLDFEMKRISYEDLLERTDNIPYYQLLELTNSRQLESATLRTSADYAQRVYDAPLGTRFLDPEFVVEFGEAKKISVETAELVLKHTLLDSELIDFSWFDIDDWTLVDLLQEEFLSDKKPIKYNVAKVYFDLCLSYFKERKYISSVDSDIVSVSEKLRWCLDIDPSLLKRAHKSPNYRDVVTNIQRMFPDIATFVKDQQHDKQAIDTVAAHLEGKNITPKKLKLIEQYIDALFEEEEDD